MRMLINVTIPPEPFNTLVRNGTAGETIGKILEEVKPESVYFTEQDGNRGIFLVVEVEGAWRVPALAEPFFLSFNAQCRLRIAMGPEDLERAGLGEIGKKWG
jgi:hypothetical protein